MMLGRADGALVFDYLIPHRPQLRALAAALCTDVKDPDDLWSQATTALRHLEPAAHRTLGL
jgi:hypothetical protein